MKTGSKNFSNPAIKRSLLFTVMALLISSSVLADYTIPSGTTVDASTITAQSGILTINGTLKISSNVSLSNFTNVIVNAPKGNIYWSNNSDLTFKAGTNLAIDPASLGCQPTTGSGNASQRLIIGSTIIAVSSDKSSNTTFTFEQFNAQGGLPDYTLTSGSSVCSGSSITATIAPLYTVNGITYSYSWVILPVSGSFSYNSSRSTATITPAAGNYTITCVATANSYSVVKTISVKVKAGNTWLGVNSNWTDPANWCPSVPTAGTDITIPASTYYPIISSGATAAVNNITIATGARLQVLGKLQVSGTVTNNGTLDITNGTLGMNGSSAQTIAGSMFYNKTVNNLIVNNTSSPGLSLSSTLNDTLKISGTLTFGNSVARLNTNDNLNLLSTVNGTASVGILGTGNSINGKVIVDRYINVGNGSGQHEKTWQFLATPTNGQTIKQSWMEDQRSSAGYGTYLTSPNGTTAGFDAYSVGAAMKYYDSNSNSWIGVSGANNSIYNSVGYMVFIRGDRTVNGTTVTAATPTILRTKGNLLTGTQSAISILPGHYQSIGNPYASPVDFSLVTKTNVDNLYYAWDPYLYGSYGFGGYQTVSGTNNWQPVPGGTSAYASGKSSKNIQSGQAVFVHSSSASAGSVSFNENSKSGSSSVNFARKANTTKVEERQFFRASLFTSPDPNALIADGNAVAFDQAFSDSIDGDDGMKILNSGENFGILRYGKFLAVEARQLISSNDTIFYKMSNLRQQTYQLRFVPENMETDNVQAFLIDNYLNTATTISLTDTTLVNISITSNAASAASGRFKVVFKTFSVLPVQLSSLTAVKKQETVVVEWQVENESGMEKYQVQRSVDGNNFITVGNTRAENKGAGKYNFVDTNPSTGNNYYRIASMSKDGQVTYSSIVKVKMGQLNGSLSVFPNPVENGVIHLQFSNQLQGKYSVRLINSAGQLIISKNINHSGSSNEVILSKDLPKGIYQLEIMKPDGSVEVLKLLN
ncbi:MAG TPA: T9SS type A sorting domain-containing protein [Hanamia sp.]|nr:T9SS type A sorting domain-containing protein [Hanamia sp.]